MASNCKYSQIHHWIVVYNQLNEFCLVVEPETSSQWVQLLILADSSQTHMTLGLSMLA